MPRLSTLRAKLGRIRQYLAHRQRTRAMQKLYKAAALSDKQEPGVLFWVPGGMPLMLHLEGAVAAALKLRQHKVHAILCDGVFSACVKREITDQIPLAEWSSTCGACKRACSDTLSQLGIPHSFIGDYVSKQDLDDAKNQSGAVEWDSGCADQASG